MTNAVATRDNQMQAVDAIRARSDQFLDLLGGDERARDRWLTVALHAVTSNPDILKCDPLTVVEAVRASASMGLELNGLMGEAYLIKYGNKAQFQVGWRGLLRLARRSGDIAAIDAQVVYSNDAFDVDLGSEPKVTHKPALSDRGNRVGVYGWARLTSGELVVEWMDNDQVELVRRSGTKGGPWVDWYDEMARKTVIKRLCKRLPLDSLAQRALEAEARVDSLAREQGGTTSSTPRPHRASPAVQRVQERLGITSGRTHGAAPVGPDAEAVVAQGSDDPPHPAESVGDGALGRVPSPGQDAGGDTGRDGSDAGARTASQGTPGNASAGNPEPAPHDGSEATPLASEPSPDMPEPPEGATDRCEAFSADHGGRCSRAPGHNGNHVASEGSWKEAVA